MDSGVLLHVGAVGGARHSSSASAAEPLQHQRESELHARTTRRRADPPRPPRPQPNQRRRSAGSNFDPATDGPYFRGQSGRVQFEPPAGMTRRTLAVPMRTQRWHRPRNWCAWRAKSANVPWPRSARVPAPQPSEASQSTARPRPGLSGGGGSGGEGGAAEAKAAAVARASANRYASAFDPVARAVYFLNCATREVTFRCRDSRQPSTTTRWPRR